MTTIQNPLPGSLGTVTVTASQNRGSPGILVALSYGPFVRSVHLIEGGDGLPLIREDDVSPNPTTYGSNDTDSPLIRILSGRWAPLAVLGKARYDGTLPPYRADVAGITGWARGIRAALREAIPRAGFSAAFADALDAASLWACGPGRADVGAMFGVGPDGKTLRDFVRANPFLSEFSFFDAVRALEAYGELDPGEVIECIPGLTSALAARFARSPWDDPDLVYALVKEHSRDGSHGDHRLASALKAILPGLRPETMPATVEEARAFCRVIMALGADTHGGIRLVDPARLVATADGDWSGLAARWESLADGGGKTRQRLPSLQGMLYWPARSLTESVLLPLQAINGTLDPPLSDKNQLHGPEDLAAELLAGTRTLSECVDVAMGHARAAARLPRALPDEANSTDAGWPALFPPTRVDDVAFGCVTTAAGLARLEPCRSLDNPHSLRTYASMGCVHVVEAVDRDASDGCPLVAAFMVTWREGRWQDVRRLSPTKATPRVEAAQEALRQGLLALPPAPRPRFWPVPVAEMVRDACGYDWRDDKLLDRAIAAVAPYLSPDMRNREALARAVRGHDARRPTPLNGRRDRAYLLPDDSTNAD